MSSPTDTLTRPTLKFDPSRASSIRRNKSLNDGYEKSQHNMDTIVKQRSFILPPPRARSVRGDPINDIPRASSIRRGAPFNDVEKSQHNTSPTVERRRPTPRARSVSRSSVVADQNKSPHRSTLSRGDGFTVPLSQRNPRSIKNDNVLNRIRHALRTQSLDRTDPQRKTRSHRRTSVQHDPNISSKGTPLDKSVKSRSVIL